MPCLGKGIVKTMDLHEAIEGGNTPCTDIRCDCSDLGLLRIILNFPVGTASVERYFSHI